MSNSQVARTKTSIERRRRRVANRLLLAEQLLLLNLHEMIREILLEQIVLTECSGLLLQELDAAVDE